MYADDTSISFAASSQTDLETKINMELDNLKSQRCQNCSLWLLALVKNYKLNKTLP